MVFGSHSGRAARHGRRTRLKRKLPRATSAGVVWLRDPANVHALIVAAVFTLATAALVAWSHGLPRVFAGQVATTSRVNRIEYAVANEVATAQRRDEARKSAPRVYEVNSDYVERMRAAIEGLPQLVRDKNDLSELDPAAVQRYALSAASFEALRDLAEEDTAGRWRQWTGRLLRSLTVRVPIVEPTEIEPYTTAVKRVVLAAEDPDAVMLQIAPLPLGRSAIQLRTEGTAMNARLIAEAVEAGFPDELARVAVAPIAADPQATVRFNADATSARAGEAAAAIETVLEKHDRGEPLFVEGDVLTADQVDRSQREDDKYREQLGALGLAERFGGALGASAVFALLLLTFASLFDVPLYRDWRRFAMLCALTLLPAALAAPGTLYFPQSAAFSALGVSLLATGLVTVVYGVRASMLVIPVQAGILLMSGACSLGHAVVNVAVCVVFALAMREVRQRATLVTAASAAALAAGVATLLESLFAAVPGTEAMRQTLTDSVAALVVTLCVGFVLMGLLPTIERAFGIVTGLTLSELRDPKQPLLRELQQRAPGTWNHSLQIANIAESAAESIGANGLLVYVGALYHDIGKMNKPEYFVENQQGVNRHDRLSPAMSLLVIVGHVKDGLELAAEYNLPRQIRQFIESHHGTTLVEYFFHAAQRRAGAAADDVNEADFRYPGPKPRSKEAAVLMLADAVESASRALSEPTPARIEQLVRDLSHKRLVDGQFDESTLTFRELRAVEDSIIKSLNAIYHGRISYPSQRSEQREGRGEAPMPKVAG